jgi:hypothetical protein
MFPPKVPILSNNTIYDVLLILIENCFLVAVLYDLDAFDSAINLLHTSFAANPQSHARRPLHIGGVLYA